MKRLLIRVAMAVALVGASVTVAPEANASANPYERGPAPTVASIEAERGPFAYAQTVVSRSSVSGFGGGTIYYPTSTAEGTFGAIAVAPGWTNTQSRMAWFGPRLASQGFVVFTIDTRSTLDWPESRGMQLLAALDYLVQSSSVRSRIDGSRLGVMGYSMGGGGSLNAARTRPALQAAIPLSGWHSTTNWSSVTVPTLIVGGESDTTAPVASHSEPFYNSLPATLDKAYLELNNGTHSSAVTPNVTVAKYTISWLKRFVDNDTRYEQFLCPPPARSALIEEYRDTCPHS